MNNEQFTVDGDRLLEFFNYDIPTWVLGATQDTLTIRTESINVIEPSDVIEYMNNESHGMSGYHSFAGIGGDWRNIDELAQLAYDYFKEFNPEALEVVEEA